MGVAVEHLGSEVEQLPAASDTEEENREGADTEGGREQVQTKRENDTGRVGGKANGVKHVGGSRGDLTKAKPMATPLGLSTVLSRVK